MKRYRLTESRLRGMIQESVKGVLKEYLEDYTIQDLGKAYNNFVQSAYHLQEVLESLYYGDDNSEDTPEFNAYQEVDNAIDNAIRKLDAFCKHPEAIGGGYGINPNAKRWDSDVYYH